jgi:hypothetical protein
MIVSSRTEVLLIIFMMEDLFLKYTEVKLAKCQIHNVQKQHKKYLNKEALEEDVMKLFPTLYSKWIS